MLIETNAVEWERREISPGRFEDVAVFSPQVLTDTEIIRYELKQLHRRVKEMGTRIERYKKYSNYQYFKEGYLDFDDIIRRLKLVTYDIEHIYNNYREITEFISRAVDHIDEGWTLNDLRVYLSKWRRK